MGLKSEFLVLKKTMSTATHVSLLVLLLAASLHTRCLADPYGNPSPPSPPPGSAVSGKTFPETFPCGMGTKCGGANGKAFACPQQCPDVKPSNPNQKGCSVDCTSQKCEAVCKGKFSLSLSLKKKKKRFL